MLSNSTQKGFAPSLFLCCVLLVAFTWFSVFFSSIISAAHIWYESEIFSHGFFVLPVSVYLIWRQRDLWLNEPLVPNFWVVFPLVAVLFVGLIGELASINVFSHFAAFSSLPLLAWLCLGNRFAVINWFPLAFVLFSIPVGQELVPWLQRITADLAVWMMGFTSIPTFNTGLYIEIPEGKFHVAEACSGIRFFVGSLVFGALYGFISYQSLKKRVLFFIISGLVPILANALRVFGIILIGHYSDMKHAVGADHLIYGWFFFALVLFLLILIGERFRDVPDERKDKSSLSLNVPKTKHLQLGIVFSIVMLSVFALWRYSALSIATGFETAKTGSTIPALKLASDGWEPHFPGYSEVNQVLHFGVDARIYNFHGFSDEGELVSSLNRLYEPSNWSLVSQVKKQISIEGREPFIANVTEIVSQSGRKRLLFSWYQLEGVRETSALKVKLMQAKNILLGRDASGSVVVVTQGFIGKTNAFAVDNLTLFIEKELDRFELFLP